MGVLAVLVLPFEQPWLTPQWPTRHEAIEAPAACSVVDTGTVRRLVPGAAREGGDSSGTSYTDTSRCSWDGRTAVGLEVAYQVEKGRPWHSGTSEARRRFDDRVATGIADIPSRPVSGLGDEARSWRDRYHSSLLVRHANVVVTVTYHPPATNGPTPMERKSALRRIAETAVRQVILV